MTIIDRYVSKGFLFYFLSALLVFVLLYSFVDILQQVVKEGLSTALMHYACLQIPYIISQTVPMACLIGSLFILNALSKNSELIAMNACGISLYRISTPILVFSFVIGIANFFTSDLIVPPTLRMAKQILHRKVKGAEDYQVFKTYKFWYRSKNAIYNIKQFDADQQMINGLDVYLFDDTFQLLEHIQAKQAIFADNAWGLHDGISITYIDNFPITHAFQTKEAEYIREKPSELKEISELEILSFGELRNYIRRHKEAGFNTLRHEVNLHAKIAYALACVVMAFLSIPFAAKNPRSGSLTMSSAFALAIAFFYWICLNAGLTYGYKGTISPIMAAWIANVLFSAGGAYLLMKRERNRFSWRF